MFVSKVSSPVYLKYRGRRWFAVLLWLLAFLCFVCAAAPLLMPDGWFALLVMAPPCLAGGWLCMLAGWAEWISRVDVREDGTFSLRLSCFRGYLPYFGCQRLDGSWHDVQRLKRQVVRGSLLGIPYDFVRHWIETAGGRIMLPAFARGDLVRDPKAVSHNIDTDHLASLFATRTGLSPIEEPEVSVNLTRSFFGGGDA